MNKNKFFKTEDLVSQNLNMVAPALSIFYKESQIIEILKRGEDMAERVLKDKDVLEKRFRDEIAESHQKTLEELERLKTDAVNDAMAKAKEEIKSEFEELLKFMELTRKKMEDKQKTFFKEMEEEIVSLSLKISEKLVLSELKDNKKMFIQYIQALLQHITEQKRVTLQISPEDYDLVTKMMPLLRRDVGFIREFDAIKNPAIRQGGVVIDMDSGILDAQIETQIAKIKKAFQVDVS